MKLFLVCNKIKKRGNSTCYPFHAPRPSHCPVQLNEQRRSPRRYEYTSPYTDIEHTVITQYAIPVKGCEYIHIPRASTVAMSVTVHESCEVSERQEQSVK